MERYIGKEFFGKSTWFLGFAGFCGINIPPWYEECRAKERL